MSTLTILRGIPASGKSTFARKWVDESPETRVRINRDDIRMSLFGKYWPVDEQAVTIAQDSMLRGFLKAGKDVVLDNTNLKSRDVKSVMKIARGCGAEVDFRDFPITLTQAAIRDGLRASTGQRSVGFDVIRSFYNRYTVNEVMPPIPVLDDEPVVQFKPYVPGNQYAYSFDIDGTLAHHGDRSPYDPTRYHEDTPDGNMMAVVEDVMQGGYKVILLTGRSEDYRAETENWLRKNVFMYGDEGIWTLFMRPSGDNRNDAIVKSEMVDKYVSGQYNVILHYDDRNRVVDALRAKGMKVAQVADGNF